MKKVEVINVMEWLLALGMFKDTDKINNDNINNISIEHIKFNKDVIPDRIYEPMQLHDGTLLFTGQLFLESISPFLNKKWVVNETLPDNKDDIVDLHYEIGEVTLEKEYGVFPINGVERDCMREKFKIPYKVHYIMRE